MGNEQEYPTFFLDVAEMRDEMLRIAQIMKGSAIRRDFLKLHIVEFGSGDEVRIVHRA